MAILVFNAGSSSLKFRAFADDAELTLLVAGVVESFGAQAKWTWEIHGQKHHGHARARHLGEATQWLLHRLREESVGVTPIAIGHRIVHGGDIFREPVLLTDDVIVRLAALTSLAPLHNPPALDVIDICRREFGEALPMVAVFDTAFHTTLPAAARCYALPHAWTEPHAIKRYGFHGIAHRYMYERYLALRHNTIAEPRVITFQLGNGCSAAAICNGRSIDTSMGYTPLEGLIMSNRCGDVDPGALLSLVAAGMDAATLSDGLYRSSGLQALSRASGDMRTLLKLESEGHVGAIRAIDAFCHRVRKYLGAYLAVLGGAEAVLFGGGIGEHAPSIRSRICADMQWCGLRLDTNVNATAPTEQPLTTSESTIAVYVIPVNEELLIAHDARTLLQRGSGAR
ncbi:MAG: acetate/propionate family kinase [Gammaproteobacteria bacterium]|nr:acetate/propionate family kinase [Gammaproteobacteria bacterium]